MGTRILRKLSLLLGSAIGAQSCTTYEYGVMVAGFTLEGEVVDQVTGEPIPGIELRYGAYTASSDAAGAWAIHGNAGDSCGGSTCRVTASDVDGNANGRYEEAEVAFEPVPLDNEDDLADTPWEARGLRIELAPIEDSGEDAG